MPKTRLNQTSDTKDRTPRLKHSPVESVKRTVATRLYTPSSMRSYPEQDANVNTWATNLSSYEYGDVSKSSQTNEPMLLAKRNEQTQQSSNRATTISEQDMSTECNVSKINHSATMMNGRVESAEKFIHRPFVSNAAHGKVGRDLLLQTSAISSHSPTRQKVTPRTEQWQQQQQQYGRILSTVVEQNQRSRIPFCQQELQNSRQSVANGQNIMIIPTLRENIIPWRTNNSPTVCGHRIEPMGDKNAMVGGCESGSDKTLDTEQHTSAIEESKTVGQPCESSNMQKQEKEQQQQQPHQQEVHQHRHHNQQTQQNAQQIYEQLQRNMNHELEKQRRALSQQEQMMVMMQQQVRPQPFVQQLNPPVQKNKINCEPRDADYCPPEICAEQLSRSTPDKTSIPHHRMLMHQWNAGYKSSQISPQDCHVTNSYVINNHHSLERRLNRFTGNLAAWGEKDISLYDAPRHVRLKHHEETVTANPYLAQHLIRLQWQQEKQCKQCETAIHEYHPIQHVRQSPMSSQQYLLFKRERQNTILRTQPSATYQQESQPQQQQVQVIGQFGLPGQHRLSRAAKKKYPGFTTEMIHDQELLLANMRQQRIPENIMRRQFDTLLGEQRHHLAFLNKQEPVEKADDIPTCTGSRVLQVDERSEWMGRVTPAHTTTRPMQNFTGNLNQQDTVRVQEWKRIDPEQIKLHGQKQQEKFYHRSNDLQYSSNPQHQLHEPNRQAAYRLWHRQANNRQYITIPPTTQPYTGMTFTRIVSPPHGISGWPQRDNDPRSNLRCRSVGFPDSRVKYQEELQLFHHKYEKQHPQRFQMRYGLKANEPQGVQQTQCKLSMNCQQAQEVECTTSDQREERTKILGRRIECGDNSNISREQHCVNLKRCEPSSLLKLREFKKYLRPQTQNNGLQDPQTVRAMLKVSQKPEANRGLEYVAELGKKTTPLKLNGTQGQTELPNISSPPAEYLQRMQQCQQPKILSNGLCNTRNANNPMPPPISLQNIVDQLPLVGYPRQYFSGQKLPNNVPRSNHKIMAENENGNIADTRQRNRTGMILVGDAPAMEQHATIQATGPDSYLSQQFDSQSTILRNRKNLVESHGNAPIMSYKFDNSEPLYQQEMEQFSRNRLNLENSGESDPTALTQGLGKPNEIALNSQVLQISPGNAAVQPGELSACTKTWPKDRRSQENFPFGEMDMVSSWQSDSYTTMSCNIPRIAEKKNVVYQLASMQRAFVDGNHGQPEIREPRTIGGLTYLARKVDYIKNLPLIAPNTLIASKFVQPLVI